MTRHRTPLMGLAATVALVAASCGGVDDTTAPAPETAASTETAGPTPSPSPSPTDDARDTAVEEGSADSNQSAESDVLTVESNSDLAGLLTGPSTGESVNAFSEKYRAETVEFDGFVADIYINPREANGKSTIDVMAGDASDPERTGPVFQLSWYGHDSPFEEFEVGDNVRVMALVGMVYEFDPNQFFLVEAEGSVALTPR